MTAYIQRKTKEIMEGKGVEGISNEEYENLNQFGKDMLSQNEMILGSTMSQITKHLHENGAMVVLTDVGDLVFDPFMGSGSTGVAARNNFRKFIGSDLKEEACKIARDRLAEQVLPLYERTI